MATDEVWSTPRLDAALLAGIALGGLCVGYLSARHSKLAVLVLLAGLAVALVARRPILIAVAAVPATYLVRRIGPGGGIGYTDVALAAAATLALPALAGSPTLQRLRGATRGLAVYLLLLLPSMIATMQLRGALEWSHRLVLVGGALVVGAWLVHEGAAQTALRLLFLVGLILATVAIFDSVTSGFQPAFPLGLHKNFVGSMLATTVIAAVAGMSAHRIRGWWLSLTIVLLSLGLVATQSRGAMIGAGAGLLLWTFRSGVTVRVPAGWRLLAIFASIGFTVFAVYSVQQQLADKLNANTNSLGVRHQVEAYTRDLWRTAPATGVGLKYFNTGNYGVFAQPANNVVDNELAESGVFGLVGFVALQAGVLGALWRHGQPLAIMGFAAVTARLLHGQFDIYWTAGTTSLPFILAGMALADTGESVAPALPTPAT